MNGRFHPRDCVKRLYVSRKEGGRGLISVEDCVIQAGTLLETYVQSSEEKILKAVRRKGVVNQETAASLKERRRTENTQGWKEMPLHGQFARQSEDQRNDETWAWLKEGKLKRNGVSYYCSTRSSNKNKYVKATIDRLQDDPKCRMCKLNNETISHIVSGCPKLAQKEYKERHDWDLSEKYGFERSERWYDHVPDSVLENEDYKMLWDFSVRTDHEIEARRPDLLIIDKSENCQS